MITDKGRTR